MKYLTLIASQDEYDTDLGFVFKGAGEYDGLMADRDGTLIAHDILEHQNGVSNIGSIRDEMEAMGGIWHVRGRWGDMCFPDNRFNTDPVENTASDFVRMARDGFDEDWTPPDIGTKEHLYDEDFRAILECARPQIKREIEDLEQDGEIFPMDDYLETALRLMRVGFVKAEKRFGDRFAGLNNFKAIQEAVKKAVKYIDYEGQEFRLGWGAGEAKCYAVQYPEDY